MNTTEIIMMLAVVFLVACGSTDSPADAGSNKGDAGAEGDSGTDVDGGDTDTGDECAATPFDLEFNTINLMIVLDRSRSMIESNIGTKTYAEVTAEAIKQVVTINDARNLINFGLSAFPAYPACTCDSENPADTNCTTDQYRCAPAGTEVTGSVAPLVPLAPGAAPNIAATLDDIGTCGGTPTCDSLLWAAGYLEALPDNLQTRDGYVLLATDGAPNCNDEPHELAPECECTDLSALEDQCPGNVICLDDVCTVNQAKHLFEDLGYKVFVIGVGDVAQNWNDVLLSIAVAGGTTSFYGADSPDDLKNALTDITSSIVQCRFDIPWKDIPDKTDTGTVNKACNKVRVYGLADKTKPTDRVSIPYSFDCSNAGGWRYADLDVELSPDGTDTTPLEQCGTVELCSGACQKLKLGTYDQISFAFGCDLDLVF